MPKKKEFNYSRDDLDRLIVDIFNGTVSPERLPVDLYNATFARLLDAVFRGFGNTLDELNDGTPEKLLLEYYQHNIAIFSGAKTFQQVNDMSNAVFTPDGYKRSFSDFKKLITGDEFHKGIFAQYNVNYLQTEYNTAVRVSQMGRQFTEYYKDADLFPYLKYIAVHDERVRDTHKHFDGVTLPVGHKFWDTHCPPNGFNCRCRVIQLSEFDDFTITPDTDVKNLPDPDQPLFGMNPAKSGFVFDPSKHPYTVKVGERFAPASKVNFGLPTPPAPTIPITIPEPPKVKTNSNIGTNKSIKELIEDISTTEDIQFAIGKMFDNNLNRKIKKFDLNFNTFELSEWKTKLSVINDLTENYNLSSIVSNEIGILKFKGGGSYYGRIVSSGAGKYVDEIDFGIKTDTTARMYDVNSNRYRQKSRVDEKNIPVATIVHEFAHVISVDHAKSWFDPTINAFWNELSGIKRKYNARLKKIRFDTTLTETERKKKIQFEHLGSYSGTNPREFMAEGFTEYKLSSNPSPVAVEIGKLIDKYFKK